MSLLSSSPVNPSPDHEVAAESQDDRLRRCLQALIDQLYHHDTGTDQEYDIGILLSLQVTHACMCLDPRTLLLLAVEYRCLEMVRLLVVHNRLVNKKDHQGIAPLHIAIKNGDIAIMELLMAHGADIHLRDDAGRSPLMIAAYYDRVVITHRLLARGAVLTVEDVAQLNLYTQQQRRSTIANMIAYQPLWHSSTIYEMETLKAPGLSEAGQLFLYRAQYPKNDRDRLARICLYDRQIQSGPFGDQGWNVFHLIIRLLCDPSKQHTMKSVPTVLIKVVMSYVYSQEVMAILNRKISHDEKHRGKEDRRDDHPQQCQRLR